jgi:hypothetical protein
MIENPSQKWQAARAAALDRDGSRCTVARLLGGPCSDEPLHEHHVVPVVEGGDPLDVDNLLTVCKTHHPTVERLRRFVLARRAELEATPRCPHRHTSAEARALCEAQLAKAAKRRARRRARAVA